MDSRDTWLAGPWVSVKKLVKLIGSPLAPVVSFDLQDLQYYSSWTSTLGSQSPFS
jgi:hypothetical protein